MLGLVPKPGPLHAPRCSSMCGDDRVMQTSVELESMCQTWCGPPMESRWVGGSLRVSGTCFAPYVSKKGLTFVLLVFVAAADGILTQQLLGFCCLIQLFYFNHTVFLFLFLEVSFVSFSHFLSHFIGSCSLLPFLIPSFNSFCTFSAFVLCSAPDGLMPEAHLWSIPAACCLH